MARFKKRRSRDRKICKNFVENHKLVVHFANQTSYTCEFFAKDHEEARNYLHSYMTAHCIVSNIPIMYADVIEINRKF